MLEGSVLILQFDQFLLVAFQHVHLVLQVTDNDVLLV